MIVEAITDIQGVPLLFPDFPIKIDINIEKSL